MKACCVPYRKCLILQNPQLMARTAPCRVDLDGQSLSCVWWSAEELSCLGLWMLTNKTSLFSTGTSYSENDSGCSSSPCENGGSCKDLEVGYQCACPVEPVAYMGKNCELLYDACVKHACPAPRICNRTPGLLEYECICEPGFTGVDCNININECESNPCKDPGFECVDGVNGYICKCQTGLSGEGCQTESSVCSSHPCLNNGTCVEGPGDYTCICQPGFGGANCRDDIDECASSPCQNGAICREGLNEYSCFCVPGFQGHNCDIDINECASRPCQNNGTCLNEMDHYVCKCVPGYTGTFHVVWVVGLRLAVPAVPHFACSSCVLRC